MVADNIITDNFRWPRSEPVGRVTYDNDFNKEEKNEREIIYHVVYPGL